MSQVPRSLSQIVTVPLTAPAPAPQSSINGPFPTVVSETHPASDNKDAGIGVVAPSTVIALSIGSLALSPFNPRITSLLVASAVIAFVSMASQYVYSQLGQPSRSTKDQVSASRVARFIVSSLRWGAYANLGLSIILFLAAITLAVPWALALPLWVILFSAALLVVCGMHLSLLGVIAIMGTYVLASISFVLLIILLPTDSLVAAEKQLSHDLTG